MTYEEAIEYITERYVTMSMCLTIGECRKHNKAISMAIEALEKQIPKKPKRVDKNYVFDGNWKKICPCCGITLMERITTKDESYPVHYNMTKHCKCGQALDWSDT